MIDLVTIKRLCVLSLSVAVMSGCVNTRYAWLDYDQKLYQHYKEPANYDQFIEQLRVIVVDGEASGKVPPGLYAEYGFALYEKGRFEEAAKYFKVESDKWPESRVLMAKMINNAETRGKSSKKEVQPSVAEGGVK